MSTIHQEQTFDDEAECIPPWSRPDPGLGQKSFVYPVPAGLERRRASPRPSRQQARAGDHLADKPSAASGLTPTQWLAQWCCLEEQA